MSQLLNAPSISLDFKQELVVGADGRSDAEGEEQAAHLKLTQLDVVTALAWVMAAHARRR